jgi:hypothetical protein
MKRWRFRKLGRIALLGVFLLMSVPFSASAVVNADPPPLVEPIEIFDATFTTMDEPVNCYMDFKFDSGDIAAGADGTYEMTFEDVRACDWETSGEVGDVTVIVTIEDNYLSFEIIGGRTGAVYVKGGGGPGAPQGNLYHYAAEEEFANGVTEDSMLQTPGLQAISHVSFCLCSEGRVEKNWEFTTPDCAEDLGLTFEAYYSEVDPDDPAFTDADWIAVGLADADADGVWTATTYHDFDTVIWFKWVVYDGTDVVFESDPMGPETLEADPGTYTNEFAVSLKLWELTAPEDYADRDYAHKAFYSDVDPEDAAFVDWIEVDLTDDDMDGVWTAYTVYAADMSVWFKWIVYDGMDVVFESEVFTEELVNDAECHTNDFELCLKIWLWSPPQLLTDLFDELTLSGFYSLDGVDYDEVVLEQDEVTGDFYGETPFECGTEIWYYFEVTGLVMDTPYYYFATEPTQETITDGLENAFVAPRTLKTFELTSCVEPAGGTYYAAWSLTGDEPWYEVELEEIAECVYSGEVEIPDGTSIYWKFYDDEWSTVVFGPETLEGATMVNRWERTGVTRTIGYWQTHPCMTDLVLSERDLLPMDICWTTLDSLEEVMAVLNWPQMSGAPFLTGDQKAILQTSRQLVAALLNEGLGSSLPLYEGGDIQAAFCAALAAEDIATIIAIGDVLDEFNNSGTEEWLPEWTWECWVAADPQLAVQLGAAGWPTVVVDLPGYVAPTVKGKK